MIKKVASLFNKKATDMEDNPLKNLLVGQCDLQRLKFRCLEKRNSDRSWRCGLNKKLAFEWRLLNISFLRISDVIVSRTARTEKFDRQLLTKSVSCRASLRSCKNYH